MLVDVSFETKFWAAFRASTAGKTFEWTSGGSRESGIPPMRPLVLNGETHEMDRGGDPGS